MTIATDQQLVLDLKAWKHYADLAGYHDAIVEDCLKAAATIERLCKALVNIGSQATEGVFTEHGDCPATFACLAIITELIDLGMPPNGVAPEPADMSYEEFRQRVTAAQEPRDG